MLIIDNLEYDELLNQSIFDDINHEIEKYIEIDNISDAKDLLDKLYELLKKGKSSETTNQYKEIIQSLKFICLPVVPEHEVASLLGSSLLFGLELEIDIFGKLDSLFNLLRDRETGFETHKLFVRSIGNNNEKLGNSKIKIKDEGKLSRQTLANWIRDFSSIQVNNKVPSYLEEAEYINLNSNVKSLSKDEKESLKNVLRLYNYLRFPVRKEDKVKETGHHFSKDESNKPNDDVVVKSYSSNSLEALKERYNEYRRERWSILRLEDEMLVRTKGDIESIKKELAIASRQNNKEGLIASAKILARQNSLVGALENSPAWINALGENIISKYSSQNEPGEIAEIVSNLKNNINSPAIVSEFLQYLLKDKLKMNENDSALVATDIGQLLGENYQAMAFGNQSTGNFEWAKNKVVDSRLVVIDTD